MEVKVKKKKIANFLEQFKLTSTDYTVDEKSKSLR